jgi:hypothetical protein
VDDRDGRGEPERPTEGEAGEPASEEMAELVPRRGRMRHQDETTTPREPTLAERRARERAARAAEERRIADEAAGAKRRRRTLVGAGVTVGVVALIAVSYSAAQPQEEVAAQCVDESGVIVDDSNCVTPAANAPYYGGVGFFPIFVGLGGRQYHYNYGGSGTIGQQVSGGTTTVPPDGTRVRTSSGSSTVTRGGLGVSPRSTSGGALGGSKSGGSVSSGSGGSKSGGG